MGSWVLKSFAQLGTRQAANATCRYEGPVVCFAIEGVSPGAWWRPELEQISYSGALFASVGMRLSSSSSNDFGSRTLQRTRRPSLPVPSAQPPRCTSMKRSGHTGRSPNVLRLTSRSTTGARGKSRVVSYGAGSLATSRQRCVLAHTSTYVASSVAFVWLSAAP